MIRHWIKCLQRFGTDGYPLPGLPLKGHSILVRNFCRSDEDARQRWEKYTEPYYLKYNFMPQGTLQNDRTFQKLKNRIRLAVDDHGGDLVGYASLKPVKGDPAAAELGICLAADQISRGYGSEVMKLLLPWSVSALNVNRIILEVDLINQRAIRLYEKFGFLKISDFWKKESNPSLLERKEIYKGLPGVRLHNRHLELLTWIMEWEADRSID
jgi:RimJ/RimL family protein N-acetyltransferase